MEEITVKEKALLIENLLSRFEYNSNQRTWKLAGPVTTLEMECVREMQYEYRMTHR